MQDTSTIKKDFSERLCDLMLKKGYSSKSRSGVKISVLCKAINTSRVMALRYLDGIVLPDPITAFKIAEWLQVDPGYLLFGDLGQTSNSLTIKLNKDFFEYALEKTFFLSSKTNKKSELLKFFIKILSELASLEGETSLEQLKKIFDLSLQSSMPFIIDDLKTGTYHGN